MYFFARILICLTAMYICVGTAVHAADYPTRPIRMIVPYPPGTAGDMTMRLIEPKLSEQLGQPVVVENKPGAGSVLGVLQLIAADPDGYTLVIVSTSSMAIRQAVAKEPPFDMAEDFAPITLVGTIPTVLVVKDDFPATDLAEMVEVLKGGEGDHTYAFQGIGTGNHLFAEVLKKAAGYEAVGVPHQGGGAIMAEILAGRVQFAFDGLPSATPHILNGDIRAIAVSGAARSAQFPDLPTVSETGMPGMENFEMEANYGIFAPAGTPDDVVQRLYSAVSSIMESPEMKEELARRGIDPQPALSPEEFMVFVKDEVARWDATTEELGFKRTLD